VDPVWAPSVNEPTKNTAAAAVVKVKRVREEQAESGLRDIVDLLPSLRFDFFRALKHPKITKLATARPREAGRTAVWRIPPAKD
jgi:citrate lyase synthetase